MEPQNYTTQDNQSTDIDSLNKSNINSYSSNTTSQNFSSLKQDSEEKSLFSPVPFSWRGFALSFFFILTFFVCVSFVILLTLYGHIYADGISFKDLFDFFLESFMPLSKSFAICMMPALCFLVFRLISFKKIGLDYSLFIIAMLLIFIFISALTFEILSQILSIFGVLLGYFSRSIYQYKNRSIKFASTLLVILVLLSSVGYYLVYKKDHIKESDCNSEDLNRNSNIRCWLSLARQNKDIEICFAPVMNFSRTDCISKVFDSLSSVNKLDSSICDRSISSFSRRPKVESSSYMKDEKEWKLQCYSILSRVIGDKNICKSLQTEEFEEYYYLRCLDGEF